MGKKIIYILIVAALISGVVVWYKAKGWAEQIDSGMIPEDIKLSRITTNTVDISIPIWFYNPTPVNLVVSDLDLKIYFDGYFISSVKTPQSYMLKSNQRSTYPLGVQIGIGPVLEYLSNKGYVINDPNWMKKVKITIIGNGTIDVGLLKFKKFPVNFESSLKYWLG